MKKSLLSLVASFMACMAIADGIYYHPDFYFDKMSSNGKWLATQTMGTVYIYDRDKDTYYEFIASEDAVSEYYATGIGNCWSDDGILVGSVNDVDCAYWMDEEWNELPINREENLGLNMANGITPDGSRIVGSVGISSISIYSEQMIKPVYWDRLPDGSYDMYKELPYPAPDFCGRVPQSISAVCISDDGKTILGQIVDWSGWYIYPIVYQQQADGSWTYKTYAEGQTSLGDIVHNRVEDLLTMQGMITRLCPKARVGVGHGKMPAEKLEKLIMDFIYGEFDVLLSTTIVENGIDIANANTIIINNAQNFGLSDLHQLRGRVGRSDRKGFCYLLSPPDELIGGDARRRLRAIEEFSDLGSGFNIAMQDLDIRGAGNLLGAEQSGFIADVGIETYQKILNQAISELRAEGLDVSGLTQAENDAMAEVSFVDDATIDIDVDASIPDSYVRSQAEKLRLYREIDAMRTDEQLEGFAARLVDRFGELPQPVRELIDVVRLRREAVALGMEHVKVKNGLMIVRFVGDNNSPFFKTDTFLDMLRKVVADPDRFVVKQYNNRLSMTVRRISSVAEGVAMLRTLATSAEKKQS